MFASVNPMEDLEEKLTLRKTNVLGGDGTCIKIKFNVTENSVDVRGFGDS